MQESRFKQTPDNNCHGRRMKGESEFISDLLINPMTEFPVKDGVNIKSCAMVY